MIESVARGRSAVRLGLLALAAACLSTACDGRIVTVPPGPNDFGQSDDDAAVALDVGEMSDAGQPAEDSGNAPDAEGTDAGFAFDASETPDSGGSDSGLIDSGTIDTGFPDAGFADAGFADTGFRDSGVAPDSGPRADGGVATSGCGTSRPSGIRTLNISVGGTMRSYVLNVPSGYTGNTPLSLVLGFHGQGWQASGFQASVPDLERSAAGAAIFAYPQGLDSGSGTAWSVSASSRDTALVDALIGELERTYCIDANRVFAFGRSYGALFANVLACVRPSVLRGVAVMMGGGPFQFTCTQATSWWGEHSQDDGTVPYSWGTQTRDLMRRLDGCGTQTVPANRPECVEYQGCTNGRRVVWCSTNGLGHNPASWADEDIWNFFSHL